VRMYVRHILLICLCLIHHYECASWKPWKLKTHPNWKGNYNGEWKGNVPHGRGMYKSKVTNNFDEDFIYVGDWVNGYRDGNATVTYKDSGNTFVGGFARGSESGDGVFTWKSSGSKFVGTWKSGGPGLHTGILTMKDGSYFDGLYSWNSAVNGTIGFSNGDKYTGKVEGKFSTSYDNGLPLMHKTGKMQFNNGDVYEGKWSYGKMNGKGIYEHSNGTVVEGVWRENEVTQVNKVTQKSKTWSLESPPHILNLIIERIYLLVL